MRPKLIVDGHLDLAWNALNVRRDLTQDAATVRTADSAQIRERYGSCTVTLPDLRRGRVGIVFGTIMIRIDAAGSYEGSGMRVQSQAAGAGRGHAAYYEALEHLGEIRILRTAAQVREMERLWQGAEGTEGLPVGVVLAFESSDPILDPGEVRGWHEIGVRCASLSHYGVGAWAHGTGTEGGLHPRAHALLDAFHAVGMILDLTHLTDRGFYEALDAYGGPVVATHHNCRTLVPGQRQLDDGMIRAIAAREGVIGASFDLWMLDPEFRRGEGNPRGVGLEAVAAQMDHVCQLTGSTRHAAVGSDLDGGFGREQSPAGIDTIAGIGALDEQLDRLGYTVKDRASLFSGNWLRLLAGEPGGA